MSTNEPDGAPDEAEPWPPYHVLCVDDNRDCADSAALLLRVMGFESLACYDGESALALNESFRPAICFLDLNMAGMEGDEVARRLLSAEGWRPLLLVAMTAMNDERSCERISAAGFHLHLVKPVEPKKLLQVVDALFHVAASNKEAPSKRSELPP